MKKKQKSTERDYFEFQDNITKDTTKSTDFVPKGVWEASIEKKETMTLKEALDDGKIPGQYNEIYVENIKSDPKKRRD